MPPCLVRLRSAGRDAIAAFNSAMRSIMRTTPMRAASPDRQDGSQLPPRFRISPSPETERRPPGQRPLIPTTRDRRVPSEKSHRRRAPDFAIGQLGLAVHPEMDLVAKWEREVISALHPPAGRRPVRWVWILRAAMLAALVVKPRDVTGASQHQTPPRLRAPLRDRLRAARD